MSGRTHWANAGCAAHAFEFRCGRTGRREPCLRPTFQPCSRNGRGYSRLVPLQACVGLSQPGAQQIEFTGEAPEPPPQFAGRGCFRAVQGGGGGVEELEGGAKFGDGHTLKPGARRTTRSPGRVQYFRRKYSALRPGSVFPRRWIGTGPGRWSRRALPSPVNRRAHESVRRRDQGIGLARWQSWSATCHGSRIMIRTEPSGCGSSRKRRAPAASSRTLSARASGATTAR